MTTSTTNSPPVSTQLAFYPISFISLWVLFAFLSSLTAQAQSVQLTDVQVSGCYLDASGNNSRATVRFLVRWSGVTPATGATNTNPRYIRLAGTGLANRDILTGVGTYGISSMTIVSPQEFALEFPLSAAPTSVTISAQMGYLAGFLQTFTASSLINTRAAAVVQLPAACPRTPCSTTALGGMVFNDYNADGVRSFTTTVKNTLFGSSTVTSGETQGVGGVAVIATDRNGVAFSTTTDQYGFYTFGQAMVYPVRVEFTAIPAIYLASSTPNGTNSRTTTQFLTGPTCTANLGVNARGDYCNTSPRIFTPCYVNGNPLLGGTAGIGEALVSVPLNAAGNNFTTASVGAANTYWALSRQQGSTWGIAWSKQEKKLFQAAILRRHVGFGPLGIGGIYVTDVGSASTTTPANYSTLTTSFIDLDAAPFSVPMSTSFISGALPNPNRPDLSPTRAIVINASGSATSGPSRDQAAFALVGKEGLGDLDISDDGNTLYTINLLTKELLSLDLTAYNTSGTIPNSAGLLTTTPIPNPGCVNGNWRPWATKYYKGDLYIGGVCDASLTAVGATTVNERKSSLWAYIYKYDGSTFTTVLDFPLTYPKGFPFSTIPNATGWYPWTDRFTDMLNTVDPTEIVYPQPMLMDIEFDTDGSMLLGLGDRSAYQLGVKNYRPDQAPTTTSALYTHYNGGDVLKAYAKNGAYILENNGQAGPFEGYGAGNSQGPGFGEYFNDDWFFNATKYHAEAMLGGLAIRPGSGQTVAGSIDPQDEVAWAGGIRLLNNNTGLRVAGYTIYSQNNNGQPNAAPGTMGKAAGLGDMELDCDNPTYLQIGNRVWYDSDADGVQDPTETGIANVSVKLFAANNPTTPLATTTTGPNGEYYFNTANGLLPNTDYVLVFGDGQQVAGQPSSLSLAGRTYVLTTANVGEGATPNRDLNDSDALLGTSGFANKITIPVRTGAFTANDHTEDVGVTCVLPVVPTLTTTPATCNGTAAQNNGLVTLPTATTNTDRFAVVSGTVTSGLAYSTATAIGGTFPRNLVANAPNAGQTYTVRFYNGSNDCFRDEVVVIPINLCLCSITATATPQSLTVCERQPFPLAVQVSPVGSYTYAWSGPANTTLTDATSASTTATAQFFGPYTFTVVVSSSPTCRTAVTVSVTALQTPGLTTFPGVARPEPCQPIDIRNYVSSSNGGSLSYYTSLSAALSGQNPLPSGVVNPPVDVVTTYYVRSTFGGTCVAVDSVQLNPWPAPVITPRSYTSCAEGVLAITDLFSLTTADISNVPALEISADASFSTLVPNSLNFTPSVTTVYYARSRTTYPVPFGFTCVTTPVTATVTVLNTPIVSVAGEREVLVCGSGPSAPLVATLSSGDSPNVTYRWVFNDGNAQQLIAGANSLTYTPPVSPTASGQYQIQAIDGVTSCSTTTDFDYVVNSAASLTLTVTPACNGSVEVLVDGCPLFNEVRWSTGDTGIVTVFTPTSTTVVSVSCINEDCVSTTSVSVSPVAFPDPLVQARPASCSGATVSSTGSLVLTNAASLSAATYTYSVGTSISGNAAQFANSVGVGTLANGVLVGTLPNPGSAGQAYIVRLWLSADCFKDVTVTLAATDCGCKAVCVPLVSRRVR